MPYKYENGKWTWIPESQSSLPNKNNSSSSSSIKPPSELTDYNDGPTTDTSDTAESEYREYEQNMIEGEAVVEPDPSLHAKKTINLQGLGRQLSGIYYVDTVTHNFSTGGYTQTLNCSREGFGDKLKKGR